MNRTAAARPVRDAIRARRSVFHFQAQAVPADVLRDLLESGTWAPNHRLTEPWRFTIVGPKTHRALADRYAALSADKGTDQSAKARDARAAAGQVKLMSKPTVVVVSHVLDPSENVRREDYAATSCAVQNVQLAAWEAGIGVQWSSGAVTRDAAAYALLGIEPNTEYIVGFLYMGYPERVPRSRRKPLDEVIRETS